MFLEKKSIPFIALKWKWSKNVYLEEWARALNENISHVLLYDISSASVPSWNKNLNCIIIDIDSFFSMCMSGLITHSSSKRQTVFLWMLSLSKHPVWISCNSIHSIVLIASIDSVSLLLSFKCLIFQYA